MRSTQPANIAAIIMILFILFCLHSIQSRTRPEPPTKHQWVIEEEQECHAQDGIAAIYTDSRGPFAVGCDYTKDQEGEER